MTNAENLRVMLVDDDVDDRKYFGEALHDINANAVFITAADGAIALSMLHDPAFTLPDVIFLDLRMPKVTGKKCLVEIKADQRLQHIPVIVYTTSKEVQEAEDMQGLGALRFVSKPAGTEEIYYIITQVLEEQGW